MHTGANELPFLPALVPGVVPRLLSEIHPAPRQREQTRRQVGPQFQNRTAFQRVYLEDFLPCQKGEAGVQPAILYLACVGAKKYPEEDLRRRFRNQLCTEDSVAL